MPTQGFYYLDRSLSAHKMGENTR